MLDQSQDFNENLVFNMAEDIVARKNQDGTVVLMRMDDSDLFYKISGVAAEVWMDLEKKKSIKEIIANVNNKYDVTADKIRGDVKNLVNELQQLKMITS